MISIGSGMLPNQAHGKLGRELHLATVFLCEAESEPFSFPKAKQQKVYCLSIPVVVFGADSAKERNLWKLNRLV